MPFPPMADPNVAAPLAALRGRRPPAPAWFSAALAIVPERLRVAVLGADIEMLSWGKRGAPGLLLLHGLGANADWWDHVAPSLAATYRVVALSWSGMGGSDWREHYDTATYMEEILAAGVAGGLFDSPEPPLVAGHSFGGVLLLAAAAAYGEHFKGAVMVDSHIRPGGQWRLPAPSARSLPVYASLKSALARFRFAPPQPCANLFIADHIARTSLKTVPLQDQAQPGWTWRFDPRCAGSLPPVPVDECLARPRCPLAFIAGGRSPLTNAAVEDFVRGTAPANSPWIRIPDSNHHVMVDQPLALTAALLALFESWPAAVATAGAAGRVKKMFKEV